jgi:hypothetical protein
VQSVFFSQGAKKSIFNVIMVQLITIIQERRKSNIMKIVFSMQKSMYSIFILRRLSLRTKIEVYGFEGFDDLVMMIK